MNDMLAAMRARRAAALTASAPDTDAGAPAVVFPVAVPVVPTVAQDREQPQTRMDAGLFPVFPLFPVQTANAEVEPRVQAAASCAACCHRTRFGNCARPIEAGLSEWFELIGHPAGGAGCTAFEPAASLVPDAVRSAIEHIACIRGWTDADVAFALDVAARCPEPADWLALAALVRASADMAPQGTNRHGAGPVADQRSGGSQ